MSNISDSFIYDVQKDHFEIESHIEIENYLINQIKIIYGSTPSQDITIATYFGAPYISFYNSKGNLIDVDHYLPENYISFDLGAINKILKDSESLSFISIKSTAAKEEYFSELLEGGLNKFSDLMKARFGVYIPQTIIERFLQIKKLFKEGRLLEENLIALYMSFYDFMVDLILFYQNSIQGHVSITNNDEILISSLDRSSGLAIIIETRDVNNVLLPTSRWNITRTNSWEELKKVLAFKPKRIQGFFDNYSHISVLNHERYSLLVENDTLIFDSIQDQTENLLKVNLHKFCWHQISSDDYIIVVLSSEREISIINTHLSIVPQKWCRKIVLPFPVTWIRVDDSISVAFVKDLEGVIKVIDLTNNPTQAVISLGKFDSDFEIDKQGNLILKSLEDSRLIYVKTNINDLVIPEKLEKFANVFSNISHLFKSDQLFTSITYAKPALTKLNEEKSKVPRILESAQYDFEKNIDHLLLNADGSYESILQVKNLLVIASKNIANEVSLEANRIGLNLYGSQLKNAVRIISGGSFVKVDNLLSQIRLETILKRSKVVKDEIDEIDQPLKYKSILQEFRAYDKELSDLTIEDPEQKIITFRNIYSYIKDKLNSKLSDDTSAMFGFVKNEIALVEKSIDEIHVLKELNSFLSLDSSALELLSLIKSEFYIKSLIGTNLLSSKNIQSRLFDKVKSRRNELSLIAIDIKAKEDESKAAFSSMVKESILFFLDSYQGDLTDQQLNKNAAYQLILSDIKSLEINFNDSRESNSLKRLLNVKLLEKHRLFTDASIEHEGKYAFVKNDPDLYIDKAVTMDKLPKWKLTILEHPKKQETYKVVFTRSSDKEVYRVGLIEDLDKNQAFSITASEFSEFRLTYFSLLEKDVDLEHLNALLGICEEGNSISDYPQLDAKILSEFKTNNKSAIKGLQSLIKKRVLDESEKSRERYIPKIDPFFIDDTPFFISRVNEFIIKAKLQLMSGAGILLLSGPPSTGKSAFLKYIASITNREYFEHASDKWQTKNSLVTSLKFGDNGPYTVPAGFTKAITTSNSLINIEEIKEWPEALRKALNPFFAGSKYFTAPDGTKYKIGDNILLCAATNLGSIYRRSDEPFTGDFWSRIEVVQYDYAPFKTNVHQLIKIGKHAETKFKSIESLVLKYFNIENLPEELHQRSKKIALSILEFLLLPKADEAVKKDNLASYLDEYFKLASPESALYNPEEAAKVSHRRLVDFLSLNLEEFFDLYNHFINGKELIHNNLVELKITNIDKYKHFKMLFLTIFYLEGGLRHLRKMFKVSVGQTEIEGTNREFIKGVLLLGLMSKSI